MNSYARDKQALQEDRYKLLIPLDFSILGMLLDVFIMLFLDLMLSLAGCSVLFY
jgi:hypothetical protein